MADSELLLQPEVLAELKRYRAAERRLQTSRQHGQEFKELAKQVALGDTIPLSTPFRDGSPAAELAATHSALRQQIEIIYKLEAQLNEQMRAPRRPTRNTSPSQSSQMPILVIRENIKIALYAIGGIVLFLLLLILLHSVIH
jgi:hypothetical protein